MDADDGADMVGVETFVDEESDEPTDPGDATLESLGYDVGGSGGVDGMDRESNESAATLETAREFAPLLIVVVFVFLFALMWLW